MVKEVTCYVEAVPGKPDFGLTTITIQEKDPDRAEFLTKCREFFLSKNRPAEADRFYQAVSQTPSD